MFVHTTVGHVLQALFLQDIVFFRVLAFSDREGLLRDANEPPAESPKETLKPTQLCRSAAQPPALVYLLCTWSCTLGLTGPWRCT